MIALLIIFGIGTEPLYLLSQRLPGIGAGELLSRLPQFEGWPGWILWAVLLTFMGTKHPPTIHDEGELDTGRKLLGFIALLIFIGCISPVPIKLA
jgi:hypothetical protein